MSNRTMMVMQDLLNTKSTRSLNYTKFDHCQDNQCFHNDEFYRQIFLNTIEHVHNEQIYRICLTNRLRLIIFIFLIFISHTNALPIYQNPSNQYFHPSSSYSPPVLQLTNQSPYRSYRRYPINNNNNNNPSPPVLNSIPSYSNGVYVQIYNPFIQNSNQLPIKRERQRRAMIDKIVILFDEDGNGQLTRDELYSMALRSNMFPRLHQYLKQQVSS